MSSCVAAVENFSYTCRRGRRHSAAISDVCVCKCKSSLTIWAFRSSNRGKLLSHHFAARGSVRGNTATTVAAAGHSDGKFILDVAPPGCGVRKFSSVERREALKYGVRFFCFITMYSSTQLAAHCDDGARKKRSTQLICIYFVLSCAVRFALR